MDTLQPDHRFTAYNEGSLGSTETEQEVTKLIEGESEEYTYALSIYSDSHKKEILESFLLATDNPNTIAETLSTPEEVLRIYKLVFFDSSVFKDKLDIEKYIETYPEEYGKDLKLCALTLGLEFLQFRYGYGDNDLDVATILKSIIESANVYASAAKINPLNSATSKEARQWMSTAIKAIETYSKLRPSDNTDDDAWTLVLTQSDDTISEENSDIPKDDLVH